MADPTCSDETREMVLDLEEAARWAGIEASNDSAIAPIRAALLSAIARTERERDAAQAEAKDLLEELNAEGNEQLARWQAAGWVHESCFCCAGVEWGGEEPRTCRHCDGGGSIWKSPKGRYALYPGGPFRG